MYIVLLRTHIFLQLQKEQAIKTKKSRRETLYSGRTSCIEWSILGLTPTIRTITVSDV